MSNTFCSATVMDNAVSFQTPHTFRVQRCRGTECIEDNTTRSLAQLRSDSMPRRLEGGRTPIVDTVQEVQE
eukprot:6210168-Pleurochrysis_carterae.AAC.3